MLLADADMWTAILNHAEDGRHTCAQSSPDCAIFERATCRIFGSLRRTTADRDTFMGPSWSKPGTAAKYWSAGQNKTANTYVIEIPM
jgi:hypothetical protein